MKGSGGGGYGSKNVVYPNVRTGSGARAVGPGGVGQLGNIQGSHVTRGQDSDYRGDPLFTGRGLNPTPYGNEVALNVKGGGPGAGRTLYGQAGSQGVHGGVNPGDPRPNRLRDPRDNNPESSRPRSNPGRSSDSDADF